MTIRRATQADIEAMVALSSPKRTQYAEYAPTFWRKAQDADEYQAVFFASLLDRDQVIALVHETDEHVDGLLIASIRKAPPVSDPGTAICTIDDLRFQSPKPGRPSGLPSLPTHATRHKTAEPN